MSAKARSQDTARSSRPADWLIARDVTLILRMIGQVPDDAFPFFVTMTLHFRYVWLVTLNDAEYFFDAKCLQQPT